jgi:Holliday junction resolvasome RuvABC endonuclease subunit
VKVLGVDLSITATGVANTDGTLETLKTKLRGPAFLDWISRQIEIRSDDADLVALEGYSYGSRGRAIFQIGEMGGIVRWNLWSRGIPFAEIPPSSLKKYATGKGNANKDVVIVEAVKRLDLSPSDNNQADAAWLRAMALDRFGQAIVVIPQVNRQALEGVAWPEMMEDLS